MFDLLYMLAMSVMLLATPVLLYVLMALGLRTLAKRRHIRHTWLAWVPVGSAWILGSLADDYQLRTKNKEAYNRVMITLLQAATMVIAAVLAARIAGVVLDMVQAMLALENGAEAAMEEQAELAMARMTALQSTYLYALYTAVSLAKTVFEAICLYHLFASCQPDSKLLYLLVSLLAGMAPVFVYLCRNKDFGMPQQNRALPEAGSPPSWGERF